MKPKFWAILPALIVIPPLFLLPTGWKTASCVALGTLFGIAALAVKQWRRSAPPPRFVAEFPPGLFALGQLQFSGTLLHAVKAVDLRAKFAELKKIRRLVNIGSAVSTITFVVGIVAGVCAAPWIFAGCMLTTALLAVVEEVANNYMRRRLAAVIRCHDPALTARPRFDPSDHDQRNHLARHYSDALHAGWALRLLAKWKIRRPIYPEDELSAFLPAQALLEEVSPDRLGCRTFGEYVRQCATLGMPDSALPRGELRPCPALPERIKALFRYKDGQLLPLDDSAIRPYLEGRAAEPRPTLEREFFGSYWATRTEAETAWAIRQLLVDVMDRPPEMMVYPDEPLALFAAWDCDSLEDVEFIAALEEHFQIDISDADAEKLFSHFTLRDTVNYLLERTGRSRDRRTDADGSL